MNILDNHIYYTICQISHDLFKKTNFRTYRGFCLTIKTAIELNDIDGSVLDDLIAIQKHLDLIYGISMEETIDYINNYFILEKYIVFEEPVRLIKDYFKNSFN